ncbi:DUF3604 domain-containing protein [Altericroceibacterium xinjiangense]|uniref:DUF3604 domain-containing protein n=1 Tax=Altericroceibacterium xinjiangense TaxID=762261 RepID=UPI000F7E7E21|nr:DUF3604 domain-containing protein [Altericroceibacterium xinjiangense]
MAAGTRLDLSGILHPLKRLSAPFCALAALSACSGSVDEGRAVQDSFVAETAPAPALKDGDRMLLWGDTHVHSINSVDAFGSGLAAADIDTAYRFARGLPVIFPKTGHRVQIDRPLDFIVMADHALGLAASTRLTARDAAMMKLPITKRLLAILTEQGGEALTRAQMFGAGLSEEEWRQYREQIYTTEFLAASWEGQVAAAERHNRPGRFTALIGWEWTSAPSARNLHRVVFTNSDGKTARKFIPFASYMSEKPEDLWAYFERTKAMTGADFVALPHNSNMSGGRMFELTDMDGNPFDADYARARQKWEPAVEITQYKGTSETHPALSPRDEFADFELRDTLLDGKVTAASPGSYVRSGLLRGLAEERRIGVNPFKYGIIGSTDSHTGLASVRENDFFGKVGEDYLPRERIGPKQAVVPFAATEMSASGLAAVWSDRNDRQAIFDAFRRREVYGTSGPRMKVRLFAGHGFSRSDVAAKDFAASGYRKGVPMGGTLLRGAAGAPPQLAIRAVKDPDAAHLDRVQVVKGWVDAQGKMHEKIFNVAWSGKRALRADGSLPPVGNTVDIDKAGYTNTIGAPELSTLWTDPEFDPAQLAFYYVRVLQIPTPRQHVFDAVALRIDPRTIDLPPTIQERAWTSPVWYRP